METLKQIKQFFTDEFTKPKCEKHPTAEYYGMWGCSECYSEDLREARRLDREDRINEIKEAILRANKEIKETT